MKQEVGGKPRCRARACSLVALLALAGIFLGVFQLSSYPNVHMTTTAHTEPDLGGNKQQEIIETEPKQPRVGQQVHRVLRADGLPPHSAPLLPPLANTTSNRTTPRPTTQSTRRSTTVLSSSNLRPSNRSTNVTVQWRRRTFTGSRITSQYSSVTPTMVYTTEAPKVLVPQDKLDRLPVPEIRSEAVNCQNLFEGEEKYPLSVQRAQRLGKSDLIRSRFLTAKDVYHRTERCSEFIEAREYTMDSITPEEADFPIAYSIVMYTDVGQAERLLRAIYRPQNSYCFHVDMKADLETELSMKRLASCFHNVFVAEKPASVSWAYYGVLEAEFICMRQLLKYKKWKYFINLTGHEFPLKSNYEIVRILKIYNGANEISNLPASQFADRWLYSYIQDHGRTSRRKSPSPHNITIHKGDAHVTLSRAFVEYILTDPVPLAFADWLKDTYCPEEFFFSSLQYNRHLRAPGALTVEYPWMQKVISRHKMWVWDGNSHCKSDNYRHYICIYGIKDLPELAADHKALFINKLMADYDPFTYDCLEELYFNRTRDEYLGRKGFDFNYYARKTFVKNHY